MKKEEFVKAVTGHRIMKVNLKGKDAFGDLVSKNEILIESIELDNGKEVYFSASCQIEVDDVWAKILTLG